MADYAVSSLLHNISKLIASKTITDGDAMIEIEKLKQELESIKTAIEDLVKSGQRDRLREWEKEIREALYQGEDLIDDFVSQQATRQKLMKPSGNRIDLAAELKKFREGKIHKFTVEINTVPPHPISSDTGRGHTRRIRQTGPLMDKTVVGLDDEIQRLKQNLLGRRTRGVEVISITGMPGIGKTTLAWKIFREPDIEFEFPTRIWVNVSEDYKPRNVYLAILKNFTSQDFSNTSDSDLTKKAREYLSVVKFFIVVDDVWKDEAWTGIKHALPLTTGSGKVLMTTRIRTVADRAKSGDNLLYELRFLNGPESWKLLQIEVYGKEEWPSDPKEIGRSISERCCGLPLAIVVIGGILKEKIFPPDSRINEWTKISERMSEYLLGSGTEKGTKDIIALSYDEMPYRLRDCFLYFCVYPRHMDICVWTLTRIWIAEEFIEDNRNSSKSLEEVAVENLNELINRNLVIVVKKNFRGEVKTCRVHDLIHEFCKTKATEDDFVRLISKPTTQEGLHDVSNKELTSRRLYIHSDGVKFLEEKPKAPRTRSFLCFSKHGIDVPTNSLKYLVEAFPRLRILDVSSIKFPTYEPSLKKLIHLRFISLAVGENFLSLPGSIVEIWNLQTLIIITSLRSFEINADIASFRNLRHLKSNTAMVFTGKGKHEREHLQNLQTIRRLSTDCCGDSVFSITPNLQTLSVCGNIGSLIETKSFKLLKSLEKLKMIDISSDTSVSQLFCEANFPPNLKILCLSGTKLGWSYMHELGKLKLEVLKLKDNAFKGEEWDVSPDEFGHLQYLQIERCNLLRWIAQEGSFPKLTSLFLSNCERLNAIPIGFAKTLQTLEIGLVTRSATLSAEEIQKKSVDAQGQPGPMKLKVAPGR